MRKRDTKKTNKEILQALFMITQMGLSMLTCMGISIAIGILLDNHFGTKFCVLIMLVIGIMASIRSMMILTGKIVTKGDSDTEEQSERGKEDAD
ncbi:AtpZ/AtpI family protein [Eubacterium xylanophilum]|uniref:AtpZ/AtpI family protein n=1 Tax=Eubacterium xylanophilum TaxID=39497 RepID=UPI00047CD884|nr:AtpZ/AtpI family protein [Eubacterium xylanophilum]